MNAAFEKELLFNRIQSLATIFSKEQAFLSKNISESGSDHAEPDGHSDTTRQATIASKNISESGSDHVVPDGHSDTPIRHMAKR